MKPEPSRLRKFYLCMLQGLVIPTNHLIPFKELTISRKCNFGIWVHVMNHFILPLMLLCAKDGNVGFFRQYFVDKSCIGLAWHDNQHGFLDWERYQDIFFLLFSKILNLYLEVKGNQLGRRLPKWKNTYHFRIFPGSIFSVLEGILMFWYRCFFLYFMVDLFIFSFYVFSLFLSFGGLMPLKLEFFSYLVKFSCLPF